MLTNTQKIANKQLKSKQEHRAKNICNAYKYWAKYQLSYTNINKHWNTSNNINIY